MSRPKARKMWITWKPSWLGDKLQFLSESGLEQFVGDEIVIVEEIFVGACLL